MADLSPLLAAGPDPSVPLALWERHHAFEVGTTITVDADAIAAWPRDLFDATLTGGGFERTRSRGRWRRARTLADTVDGDLRVLLVGLNPSVYSADVGSGFARPGNRFWPAAIAAGLVTTPRDPHDALVRHRVGMTDLVKRATARADELSADEYRSGAARLALTVGWLQPRIVCIVGLTGWRTAVDKRATSGLQAEPFGGRPVYVMPNPSGLNAHVTPAGLADHFRAVLAEATP